VAESTFTLWYSLAKSDIQPLHDVRKTPCRANSISRAVDNNMWRKCFIGNVFQAMPGKVGLCGRKSELI
jgi:hypothetical protein